MTAISAIVTYDGQSPQEILNKSLIWSKPPFGKNFRAVPKSHSFQNVTIGVGAQENIASDPSGMLWVAFTGQLFHKEKISPEIIILDLYRQHGVDGFCKLKGEFAFLLLDQKRQELYAVRDRLGIYPLYWQATSRNAHIATSLKSLLSTGYISPTPDMSAIASSLAQGFISQDATCIEGVNRLLPGYYLKLSLSGSFKINSYWSFSDTFAKEYSSDFDSSVEIYCELERKIEASINERSSQRAHLLSGTLGSYIIYDSLKTKAKQSSLVELTLQPNDFLDSLVPIVWAMEMPNAETSAFQTWQFVKRCQEEEATPYFDTGFAEEFYDYSKDALELFQSHYKVTRSHEPTLWSKLWFSLMPRAYLQSLRKSQEATPQIAFLEKKLLLSPDEFAKAAPELSRHFDLNLFIHQFYHLARIPKLDASLFYLTMKSSVSDGRSECRMRLAQSHDLIAQNPFMDFRLLEFFASITPEAWASPDLIAAFPNFWLQNHEAPPEIYRWPKALPVPEALLLAPEVWSWIQTLQRGLLVDTGLISASWIKKALKTPKEHLGALYAMLVLEIWMRLFIDLPLRESNKDLKLQDLMTGR